VVDLSDTIVPRSDQMNAEDLLTGPRTFTIREVRKTSAADQPVSIVLDEFPEGRPFKPSKTVRRILIKAWGKESAAWTGRRLTLYRDPDVRFGGEAVGGIRVSHLSHIGPAFTLALTVTRGRRAPFRVEPLPDDVPVSPSVSADTLTLMRDLFARKGIPEDAQLQGVNRIIGGSATGLEVITEQEAQRVVATLQQRPDVEPAAAEQPDSEEHDPTTDPGWGQNGGASS
jgi:hypothetical protein